jgi:hypothetical protein
MLNELRGRTNAKQHIMFDSSTVERWLRRGRLLSKWSLTLLGTYFTSTAHPYGVRITLLLLSFFSTACLQSKYHVVSCVWYLQQVRP